MEIKQSNMSLSFSDSDSDTDIDYTDPCGICMGSLSNGKSTYVIDCKHTYHNGCIVDWLQNNPRCPYCRKNLSERNIREALVGENRDIRLLEEIKKKTNYGIANAKKLYALGARLTESDFTNLFRKIAHKKDDKNLEILEFILEIKERLPSEEELNVVLLWVITREGNSAYKSAKMLFDIGAKLPADAHYNALIESIKQGDECDYNKLELMLDYKVSNLNV